MKNWLRGKRGGLIVFGMIAALVGGGLGWVTQAALHLEEQQLAGRAEAELHAQLRLALWRLDSFMIPELARESSRPPAHYSAVYAPYPTFAPTGKPWQPGACLELSPLLTTDLPDWMLLHFTTTGDGNWWSPQVLSDKLRQRLGRVVKVPFPSGDQKKGLLKELGRVAPKVLQDHVPAVEQNSKNLDLAQVDDQKTQYNFLPYLQQNPTQQSLTEFQNRQQVFNYTGNTMVPGRTANSKQSNPGYNFYFGTLSPNEEDLLTHKGGSHGPEMAVPGAMTAFWVPTDKEQERLLVARQVRVGSKHVWQGVVLNWEALRKTLTGLVNELFPEARLHPMREATPPHPERTMTALPVELDPGFLSPPAPGWTPLRIGLALAWTAALIALLAVGLGGWSLLDLSERRIRFVSAVTHELRTPLTTLRLYLDMLTGGMVREEKQKEEYLHTLNAETDRLHRLVGNVLDFSRLENQKPRLEKATVKVSDLLEQVRSTWDNRCQDGGKELIVENTTLPETTLITDLNLVQQVLGNLIDNACKYSRSASDRRLWLRARPEGKRICFEVEDRGPGIPAKERRSIFRPFRRGRDADVTAGGVGLGLALARRWTFLLGGQLTMRSGQDNVGACFRLELPG